MAELYYQYWAKTAPPTGEGLAREYHRLPYHLLDVAAVGKALLTADLRLWHQLAGVARLPKPDVRQLVVHTLALHDVGKFANSFQQLCPEICVHLGRPSEPEAYRSRHDVLGYLLWQDALLRSALERDWWNWDGPDFTWEDVRDVADPIARAVFGHHGRPPRVAGHHPKPFDHACRQAALAWFRDVSSLLPQIPLRLDEYDEGRFAEFAWLLAGIAVLADWIGSNRRYFPFETQIVALGDYWERAVELATHAVADSGVVVPLPSDRPSQALLPHVRELTPLQQHAAQMPLPEGPCCFILEDDTGAGKTEAALLLAHRLLVDGRAASIYFGLPTMATANAMYERMIPLYRRLFGDQACASLILAHSARHLVQFGLDAAVIEADVEGTPSGGALCARWLADSRKKALLAGVGVGTIDQAMLAALPSNHQSLRLLGVARGVLIVDEVHAYDAYMLEVLAHLLRFTGALGGSAILLSATLPHRTRLALMRAFSDGAETTESRPSIHHFPMATVISTSGVLETPIMRAPGRDRAIELRYESDIGAVTRSVREAACAGKAVCWVRNTVRDAVTAYQALRADPGLAVDLFHSRFAMGDRLTIEGRVLGRFGRASSTAERAGHVLVATQVVEQSLDLDFDFLVSDLAPIDLLIQRAGRLHRHSRGWRGSPQLVIHGPAFTTEPTEDWLTALLPGAARVYRNVGLMWRTARECQARVWRFPDMLRGLVDAVYDVDLTQGIPPPLQRATERAEGRALAEGALGAQNALNVADGYRATQTQWLDDTYAPTRLGEPTTTVRLVVRDEQGTLKPWVDDSQWGWQLSEVGVHRWSLASAALHDVERTALEGLMPDRGQWSVPVVLDRVPGEGPWRGNALNASGGPVRVSYDRNLGLQTSAP